MKTILVINDIEEIRENTVEILELSDYVVLTASEGQSGFSIARSDKPDLILYDIMMPGSNGQEFLERIKQDDIVKKIPIIIFSTGSGSQIQKGLKADGVIKKPFAEEELLAVIKNILV